MDAASGSNAPNDKRKTRNDECGPNGIAAVDESDAVTTNVEQTGGIFKLDLDCFRESFDYLPFEDLVNMGKTCKQLQQVAGYCFQKNYSGRALCSLIRIKSYLKGTTFRTMHDVEHFVPFINKIWIKFDGFQHFLNARSKFHQLNEIEVNLLSQSEVSRMKEFPMSEVEVLRFHHCNLHNYFHEIINQCSKLKRLEIKECSGEFNWIDYKYPTLEYLTLNWCEHDSVESIPKFLELNPNIRKFATKVQLLLKYRNEFMSANVKLDDLAICSITPVEPECNLLNALYDRGFYKNLEWYFKSISNQEEINKLIASVNGLVKLFVHKRSDSYAFSVLTILEELYVVDSKDVADLDMLSNNLINLKRIHFERAGIDDIIQFIRRSVKMREIKVDDLQPGVHFDEDTEIIDLFTLNREREQLPDAKKITLYVKERVYLATKWAMNETDFGLIRLKRFESFGWNHDFKLTNF